MALTPLAVAALGLLTERPMHPYEMFQLLIQRGDDQRIKVRPGTLYHSIERMQRDGLVRATGTDRAGNRPERTTYEVTEEGRGALAAWVRDTVAVPVNEYPVLPVAIGEIHNLPAEDAVALIGRRVAVLTEDERRWAAAFDSVQARGVAERYLVDLDYLRAVTAAERDWLRRLADRIGSGEIDWPGPDGAARPERGTP